jgi:hypothetical protein
MMFKYNLKCSFNLGLNSIILSMVHVFKVASHSEVISNFYLYLVFSHFINYQMSHCFFMTYLHITFKNLKLYGSWCIFFKFKHESMMGINGDNKVFFFNFINYQMSHSFFQASLILTPHIKTWHCIVQDAYALSANINK